MIREISRTAFEWPWVGLRVSDKADVVERSIALERRRWLKRKLDGPKVERLRLAEERSDLII